MKRFLNTYFSIDGNLKMNLIGMLAVIFIPVFGSLWYGTRFTTQYHDERQAIGTWILMWSTVHVALLLATCLF